MPDQPAKSLLDIARATRYPIGAFQFVRQGLDFTVHQFHKNPEAMDETERHVSGRDLTEGLRDFAIEQYGLLARPMLARWNIHRTEDFGHIVFAMVEHGLMQATETDTIRDFENGFDFETAFNVEVNIDDVAYEDARQGITGTPGS